MLEVNVREEILGLSIRNSIEHVMSKTTIGMEIEFNPNERNLIPTHIYSRYIYSDYSENGYIYEINLKWNYLKNIRNTLRKYTLLTYYLTSGGKFYYDKGLYDIYSGSNHLHLYLPYSGIELEDFEEIFRVLRAIQFIFSPFFSRTSQTFRINSSDRFMFMQQSYDFDYDSKRYGITEKGEYTQLEFRINENFLPFYAYILVPVLHLGLYKHNENELTEFEKNLIKDIKEFGKIISYTLLNNVYKRLHVLTLRKIRNPKFEYKRVFENIINRIFTYTIEYYKFATNLKLITSPKSVFFLIDFYKNTRDYYINKRNIMKYYKDRDIYDRIVYPRRNANIWTKNPNSKLLNILMKYLVNYDKTTKQILEQIGDTETINKFSINS